MIDSVKNVLCCRMAGGEKFGYFCLSEQTEGEDGSLSNG